MGQQRKFDKENMNTRMQLHGQRYIVAVAFVAVTKQKIVIEYLLYTSNMASRTSHKNSSEKTCSSVLNRLVLLNL